MIEQLRSSGKTGLFLSVRPMFSAARRAGQENGIVNAD